MKEGISLYTPIPDNCKSVKEIENLNIEKEGGEFHLIKDGKKIKGKFDKRKDYYNFRINRKAIRVSKDVVENFDMWVKYKRESETPKWVDIYNKRIGKEHNFDTLKNQMNFRILRRGRKKANFEAKLYAIAFNLKKLFALMIEKRSILGNCVA